MPKGRLVLIGVGSAPVRMYGLSCVHVGAETYAFNVARAAGGLHVIFKPR